MRELDNVVQRALILQTGELLAADDLGIYGFAQFGRRLHLRLLAGRWPPYL